VTALAITKHEPVKPRASEDAPPADPGFASELQGQLATPYVEPPPELANLMIGITLVRPEAPPPAPTPVAPPALGLPTTPLTPLEQAIVDLIVAPQQQEVSIFEDDDEPPPLPEIPERGGLTEVAPTTTSAPRSEPVKPAIAVAQVALETEQEQAVPQSHVHLVLDDGAERVVMTVAVRGNDVNVSLRASDDHTGAALARNAATLDHALRARKLELAGFSMQRDQRDQREQRQHEQETA
jgi:hypothetical protein